MLTAILILSILSLISSIASVLLWCAHHIALSRIFSNKITETMIYGAKPERRL